MDFAQKRRFSANEQKYHIENLKVVREFSKSLILEMRSVVKAIVLFGSNTKDTLRKDSDIDLMIVLDNVSVFVTPELREAYRIIVNKLVAESEKQLHIMTVNFSDLWDMARKGDPLLLNVLRYGLAIYDNNLIDPMQYLLEIGKIRPSREAVNNYMARSETLLTETRKHLEDAVLDLYYSVVDMVHATLMIEGMMPPAPKDMPGLFRKRFKGTKLEKSCGVIEEFYKVAKEIERNRGSVDGKLYDALNKRASVFIAALKSYNDEQLAKKDMFDL
jgi:predicted nucleotidyltransferase